MDYKNSKIYVIRNHCNDFVYVGSTTQSLSKRFSWHKADMKKKNKQNIQIYKAYNELGMENFYIELLELYPCSCRDELNKKEGEYIRKFDSYNNGYNGCIAGRSNKEYREEEKEKIKKYYEDNKEKIKDNYEKNKKDILNKRKVYRELNKQKIKLYDQERNKIKYSCECGGKYAKKNKKRHYKSKKHLDFIKKII